MHDLSPPELASRCQNSESDSSHEPFCLRLFRRAIVDGCSLAWHYVHQIYFPLVRYWVYQRASTLQADRIDDLTQETFLAFWRFFTPDKLERATELSEVLSYLRSCAYTAVARFYRQDNKTPPTIPLQPFFGPPSSDRRTESTVLQRTYAEQVWAAIEGRCQDEQERVLAYATFVMEMKPRQICRQYPDLFPSREHVYRAKHTLITRLRRDPTIRALNDAVECKKREDRD